MRITVRMVEQLFAAQTWRVGWDRGSNSYAIFGGATGRIISGGYPTITAAAGAVARVTLEKVLELAGEPCNQCGHAQDEYERLRAERDEARAEVERLREAGNRLCYVMTQVGGSADAVAAWRKASS